jgi:sulfotransferase
MIKKVLYNSSFPRSGSTLLQNILAQNPDIYSSPTSGLFDLLTSTKLIYSDSTSFLAQDQKQTIHGYRGLLKGAMYGYYGAMTDRPYAIDKYRGWLGEYKFINDFDPNPKIICMVRDLRSIYSSIEKKYRQNPLMDHQVTSWHETRGTSTYKRVIELSNAVIMSTSTESLYQAILEGYDKNIFFLKFEDFCINPNFYMKQIYKYLELPNFSHNFDNIEQVTHENDQLYGSFGDHIIQPKLEPVKEDFQKILGNDTCNLITSTYKWYYDYFKYKI